MSTKDISVTDTTLFTLLSNIKPEHQLLILNITLNNVLEHHILLLNIISSLKFIILYSTFQVDMI